jgi:hypothetical protein
MTGKILFMIISGIEEINKARWGLRMALNTFTHPYGEKLIDEVRVLLFCDGVKLVEPSSNHYIEIKNRIFDLINADIEVVSCISIAEPLGLVDETNSLGIKCVHASAYVAKCVREGFNTITF